MAFGIIIEKSSAEEAIPVVTPREVNLSPEAYHGRIVQVRGWLDFHAYQRNLYQYEFEFEPFDDPQLDLDCLTVLKRMAIGSWLHPLRKNMWRSRAGFWEITLTRTFSWVLVAMAL